MKDRIRVIVEGPCGSRFDRGSETKAVEYFDNCIEAEKYMIFAVERSENVAMVELRRGDGPWREHMEAHTRGVYCNGTEVSLRQHREDLHVREFWYASLI